MMRVLLTVPHGCEGCDIAAPGFAMHVSKHLDDFGIKNTKIVSTTKRKTIDMNRLESRSTSYRRNVSKIIGSMKRDDVLIDVHSFPSGSKSQYDVYFLNIVSSLGDDGFIRAMHAFLEKHGVRTGILEGSDKNDIVTVTLQRGLENVALVEINESLSPGKAKKIAGLVASFISSLPSAVVLQTHGVVTGIASNKVTVYIDIDDIHDIYAPVSGKIKYVTTESGDFDRYLKVFRSWERKRGRLTIGIRDVKFLVEVGEGYVTDRVRLKKGIGDTVKRGDVIGHIVLGSLSEIYLPIGYDVLVREGETVAGGTTIAGIRKVNR
jgi:hypothetical protein